MYSLKYYIYGVLTGCLIPFCYQVINTINNPISAQVSADERVSLATSAIYIPSNKTLPTKEIQELEHDSLNTEMIEAIQAERIHTLRAACKRYYKVKSCVSKIPFVNPECYLSRNYKFTVCTNRKCGFSAWMRAVLVMEDLFTVDDYLKKKLMGDEIISYARSKISFRSIHSMVERTKQWKEMKFKIITVRNPFSRLVSAYYDKMIPTSTGYTFYYGPMSQKINQQFRHLRHNVTERSEKGDGHATFEDFINYILAQKGTMDGHWDLFATRCIPCSSAYNYIVKLETLNMDINYLKKTLNVSQYHQRAFFPQKTYRSNWDLVKKTFQTIPKTKAQNLYEKYKKDFEMFGYDKPEWLC